MINLVIRKFWVNSLGKSTFSSRAHTILQASGKPFQVWGGNIAPPPHSGKKCYFYTDSRAERGVKSAVQDALKAQTIGLS